MKNRMVNALYLGLLIPAAFLLPIAAQQPLPVAAATRHCLWRVEGHGKAVYLLGSVHFLKAEDYPLPAPIEAAFTNARIVAFETDIGAMQGPETQLQLLSKATLPQGQTLRDQLSPSLYTRFTNQLEQTGLPAAMVASLKPAVAAMALEAVELQKLGYDPEYGLDKHFYNRARKAGKQVVPLETVEFQIGLLTGLSKEEGELVVKTTLEEIDKTKTEVRELLKAWQTGDADALEKMLNEASREAPAIFKRLVTDRNERWLPQIEAWLRDDSDVIVIVGAGHLVGKEGVVELLRKKGFKVTQL
jgi:uncharacterized protein YbaP (TraB family)